MHDSAKVAAHAVGRADPRDFCGSAGSASKQLGEKRVSTFDINALPGVYPCGGPSGSTVDYARHGGAGMRSAVAHPTGLRRVSSILESGATSPWDEEEWAGSTSDGFQPGSKGQRKWEIWSAEDAVGVRSVSDISNLLYVEEAKLPSAG